jgi:hypothetical protein
MHTLRESPLEQRARLSKTPQGKALLELLDAFPTKRALAAEIGSSAEYISRCIREGALSKSGAILADDRGLMSKEALRPDVSREQWEKVPPGLPIGVKPSRDGVAQVLLCDLAKHFGSVKAFCKAAGVTVATFHDWNTRNRVSASGMLKLVALKGLNRELRARIKAAVDAG